MNKETFRQRIKPVVEKIRIRSLDFYVNLIFGTEEHLQIREVVNRLYALKTRMRYDSLSKYKKGIIEGHEGRGDIPGRDEWFIFFATEEEYRSREHFHSIIGPDLSDEGFSWFYGTFIFQIKPSAYRKMNWNLIAPMKGGRYAIEAPQKGKITHDIISNGEFNLRGYIARIFSMNPSLASSLVSKYGYDFPVFPIGDYERIHDEERKSIWHLAEVIRKSKTA